MPYFPPTLADYIRLGLEASLWFFFIYLMWILWPALAGRKDEQP